MSKIDPKRLGKDIHELAHNCCTPEDREQRMKSLFENNFGVAFEEKRSPKKFEVWEDEFNDVVLILCEEKSTTLIGDRFSSLKGIIDEANDVSNIPKKFLASSPEEYFRKKFAGEFE